MLHLTTAALFLQLIGIFASVSLIGIGQAFLLLPMLYYFYLALKSKELRLSRSTWALIAFILVCTLSIVVNTEAIVKPGKSLGKLRYMAFGILSIPLLKHYILNVSSKTKQFLLYSLLTVISIIGFVCFYQVFWLGMDRAKTLTDTLRYGYGIGMVLPILLFTWLKGSLDHLLNRKILILASALGFCSLYLTLTRGAMLGFICALPLVIIYWNRRKGGVAFALCGTIVLGLGGFYLFGSGEIGNRFISSRKNSSDSVRFTQWEAAYRAWSEKPVLGIGFSDFINQEQKIKEKYGIAHADYKGHAHNILLETLAGAGILGLMSFLLWIGLWSLEVIKTPKLSGYFIPYLVAFFVSGQFEVVFDANNATFLFMFFGLFQALASIDRRVTDQRL